jgi:GNAT superfamily N-acetyltransferase
VRDRTRTVDVACPDDELRAAEARARFRTCLVRNACNSGCMTDYRIEPLGPDTWDAVAALIERHNGIFGGCWCTWFHDLSGDKRLRVAAGEDNRAFKQRLVHEGKDHAAVVLDGDRAVAWCQYGPPDELPNIHHRKEYDETLTALPDYRLTCIFVDRDYRRHGLAELALRGALEFIAKAGGGVVEGYPHDTKGKKVSASFLYNATRTTYERCGFVFDRPKGDKNTVMVTTVMPTRRKSRQDSRQI